MKRNIDLNEISDGRLYDVQDMAKLGCNDCAGCSACCRGMGGSIILDPLDVYRLEKHLNTSFEALLSGPLELNVVDGVILPNIKMAGSSEKCSFLNEEGRCSIHEARPGICRLFPLGRFYENGDFKYFLQVHECEKKNRTKVKISKWIAVDDIAKNKEFILDWHYFLNDVEELIANNQDEEFIKKLNMTILTLFFVSPYDTNRDFYEQYKERRQKIEVIFE